MNSKLTIKLGVITALSLSALIIDMGYPALGLIWAGILLWTFKKIINKLISLLLTLEMFSLLALLISPQFAALSNSCSLIFIIIRLRVGEGVLGLALLVKFVRDSNVEQTRVSFL